MLKFTFTPQTVRISNDFFKDGSDLLNRFEIIFESHGALKSMRLKCFIDLRMAFECFLKSLIAFHEDRNLHRRAIIQKVEAYGHNVPRLSQDVCIHLPCDLCEKVQSFAKTLNRLPIGLRYALDGYDFIVAKEEEYYKTIGRDSWLYELFDLLVDVQNELNRKLKQFSGIVCPSAYLDELLSPPFNKFGAYGFFYVE